MRKSDEKVAREYTEARNEIAVLEALTQLGQATAKEIADHAGINYLAARSALRRQLGFSLECDGQTWWVLDEPTEPDTSRTVTIWERRTEELERYLMKNRIQWCRTKVSTTGAWYSEMVPATDIKPGDRLAVYYANLDRFQPVYRVYKSKNGITFFMGKHRNCQKITVDFDGVVERKVTVNFGFRGAQIAS